MESYSFLEHSYIEWLTDRIESGYFKKKGERSRERLKLAAARNLETKGYHEMRVADITHDAGVSDGAFYVYFQDKRDVTLAVMKEFVELLEKSSENSTEKASQATSSAPFEMVRRQNLRYISVGRANAGLMRCILQITDQEAEFDRLVQKMNHDYYLRITKSALKKNEGEGWTEETVLFLAYSLGAMMDEVFRRLVIQPDKYLCAIVAEIAPSDAALADLLSIIWIRVLYPSAIVPEGLSRSAKELMSAIRSSDNAA